jgi:hypothetical protein
MKPSPIKARSDSWDAALDDAQRWRAYDRFRHAPWYEVSEWVKTEFALPRAPGRNALYRWAARMRSLESAHRIEQAIQARDEVGAMAAAAGQSDARLIDAYKALAADVAMRNGDAATAGKFTKMALAIADAQTRAAELALRERIESRTTAAEKRATAAEAETTRLRGELAALRAALEQAGKGAAVDPAAVAAALDKHLGRKP